MTFWSGYLTSLTKIRSGPVDNWQNYVKIANKYSGPGKFTTLIANLVELCQLTVTATADEIRTALLDMKCR